MPPSVMVVDTPFGGYQRHKNKKLHSHQIDFYFHSYLAFDSSSGILKNIIMADGRSNKDIIMADGKSNEDIIKAEGRSKNDTPTRDDTAESSLSSKTGDSLPASRTRPKLGRASTVDWINKSFDHSVSRPEARPPKHRQMRRQSSVSDFFHSMLTKSKSQIVGIFSGKREKREKHLNNMDFRGNVKSDMACSQETLGNTNSPNKETYRSPSAKNNDKKLSLEYQSDESNTLEHFRNAYKTESVSRSERDMNETTSSIDKLTVTRSSDPRDGMRKLEGKHNLDKSSGQNKITASPKSKAFIQPVTECHSPLSSSPSPMQQSTVPTKKSVSSQLSQERSNSDDSNIHLAPPQRSVWSAPAGRTGLSSKSHSLMVKDTASLFKRALVKSNSETFATESMDQNPIVKASSDGNCFKKEPLLSLGPTCSFMSRITNYLFLGSVEAAYSEPLLCKYNISALIDMTNMPSANVPLHKKIDCPCACVNKNHFRSRLNIGIDDIEWEDLAQYFDELNNFINGARRKGGRILVFSYMGQSRAAAAIIQHLMIQYNIPYNEAFHIVKSKRHQTKINSGFVKALRRLEDKLGLLDDANTVKGQKQLLQWQSSEELAISRKVPVVKKEESELSFPYVVRGAWLEC